MEFCTFSVGHYTWNMLVNQSDIDISARLSLGKMDASFYGPLSPKDLICAQEDWINVRPSTDHYYELKQCLAVF